MNLESRRSSASLRHWKLNWWDLWPLVDGERRPIQWTTNSVILSPHPSSPAILARSFPSSSSFVLPTPNPVLNNPSAFAPPSIIAVSPDDEYVFAFFDGKGGDNAACIWHREETMDTWKVNIFWPIKPGQGIVFAKWLGGERIWLRTSPPTRAPPLGPTNPFGKTTLLLVNQCHMVQIVYRTSLSLSFQLVSASLRHASQAHVLDRPTMGDTTNGQGGLNVCVKATVGLGYNESSIIIATSSKLIPPTSTSNPEFADPFGVPDPSTPSATSPSRTPWENYGAEQTIHLCEVKLTAYNFIMGIATRPLQPLFPQVTSSSRLTDIVFIPHLAREEPSSPEGSVVDRGSPIVKEESNTLLHVVLAYLDLEDYLSPRSDLVCFELKRNQNLPTDSCKSVSWSHRHLKTRTITNSAVSFLLPVCIPGFASALAGFLDLEGFIPKSSTGENHRGQISIGKLIPLRVPQLEDDEDWEPSRLMTGLDDVGTEPPISAAASPCKSLICTSPSAWSTTSKLGVYGHPHHKGSLGTLSVATWADSLLSTILSDRRPADIVHVLANPIYPLSSVIDVLEHVLRTLDCSEFPTRDWYSVIVGISLEIFRARSNRPSKEATSGVKEESSLDERWHVALDICSVKALKSAFEACKEDDGYDLEPVWQLISLSTWLVEFVEKLVRACVVWEGGLTVYNAHHPNETPVDKSKTQSVTVKLEAMEVYRDDLFDGDLSPAPDNSVYNATPPLIHIIHPYALDNLIGALSHLNAFRAFFDTLTASRVQTGIAKEVVVDVIDYSGIDFKELESGLRTVKTLEEFIALDGSILQRSFCSVCPLPATHGLLVKACSLITSSKTVSKSQLFIRPSDLVDGISKLNLTNAKMSHERDIISKGVLGMPAMARTCARCNSRTQTGQSHLPRGKETSEFGSWAVWEHEWERCICGGFWVKEVM